MQNTNLFISFSNTKSVALIPSSHYSLQTNETIIYTIYLPDFITLKTDLKQFLNSKERDRAERFHKELDRNRFIIYRSILKFVLAAYTKLDVKNINLDYHFNKKPYLASHPELHFNISHSEEFAVIAISSQKVGIDIECTSENFDFTDLIPEIFNDNEILMIENAVNKKQAFYTLWTRKEALVKAIGKGIDHDFKYIPCLEEKHCLNTILPKNTEKWELNSFTLADHYLGAIAIENCSTISPNKMVYAVPNKMKELLKMNSK